MAERMNLPDPNDSLNFRGRPSYPPSSNMYVNIWCRSNNCKVPGQRRHQMTLSLQDAPRRAIIPEGTRERPNQIDQFTSDHMEDFGEFWPWCIWGWQQNDAP